MNKIRTDWGLWFRVNREPFPTAGYSRVTILAGIGTPIMPKWFIWSRFVTPTVANRHAVAPSTPGGSKTLPITATDCQMPGRDRNLHAVRVVDRQVKARKTLGELAVRIACRTTAQWPPNGPCLSDE